MSDILETKKRKTLNNSIEVDFLKEFISENEKSLLDSKGRAYATGRRKQSSARLWLSIGNEFKIEDKTLEQYFEESEALISYIKDPLVLVDMNKVKIYCTVSGGGKVSQASAIRLAISKALVLFDPSFRLVLRKNGFLTTDARRKEREHYGFRTSRKRQQYCRR